MRYGKRHRPEQIIAKLREADAMLHRWRNQYGEMKANEAKRPKPHR